MIIKPKVRGFMCTTSHPVGCEASVKEQIAYVKNKGDIAGPKRVLVLGSSTGYGLASRITAAFGCGASTIGRFSLKSRVLSVSQVLRVFIILQHLVKLATEAGLYNTSFNGDAFSNELKSKSDQNKLKTI